MQNLQATINWCGPFINYRPLNIAGTEPAVSSANVVLDTIMGPPFAWRWNRAELSFNTVNTTPATQDYVKVAADFGFIEKAWLTDAVGEVKEIEVVNVLSGESKKNRPANIALQYDDQLGNITFRLMPPPGAVYTVKVAYQKKPVHMASLASAWGVPEEYSHIYQWGFLALATIFSNDPRFPIFNQKFISNLLGAQEGLDDTQRNIFLGNWLEITKQAERAGTKTQQGIAARQK